MNPNLPLNLPKQGEQLMNPMETQVPQELLVPPALKPGEVEDVSR